MDLRQGFSIEVPAALVPWNISEEEFTALFPEAPPRHVARGYFTLPVTVLGGLRCMLGFHFRKSGRLSELEFFRTAYPDQRASFDEFQQHFELEFGAPAQIGAGDEGFPTCEWQVAGATIRHFVFSRYGLEEHMRIRCASA